MEAKKLDQLSIPEYLELERKGETKYEYDDGRVFAMAGGTFRHGVLCGNVFGELRSGLRSKESGCQAYTSEIKVHIQGANAFVYPDALVICGPPEHSEEDPHAIQNPKLVVEVLSKSSANYDRGAKFHKYRKLESLSEYLLIEQDTVAVELYQKLGDLWKITRVEGLEASITLDSVGLVLDLALLYEGMEV